MPSRSRRGPLASVATVPPTVAPGSGSSRASCWPAPASRSASAASGTPARTTTTRSPAACSTTPVSRRVSRIRSSRRGGVPQSSLVPAPRATTREVVLGGHPQQRGRLLGRPGAAANRADPPTASRSPASPRPGRRPSASSTSVDHLAAGRRRRSLARRVGTGTRRSRGRASPGIRTPPRARPPAAGARPRCRPGTSPHSRGVGKTLPGLASPAGSNAHRSSCMVSRSSAVNMRGMCLALSDAHPVLAGDRAAVRDAQVEDRAGHLLGRARPRPRHRVVEEHQRVQVAVAGVEDVGHPDAGVGRQRRDRPQHLRQRGPRDHPVLHDVVRADPADRGERGLAPLPEQRPLRVVGGDPDLERAVLPAEPLHLGELRLHLGRRPVQLDDQHRPGAGRVSTVRPPPRPPRWPARPSSRSRPAPPRRAMIAEVAAPASSVPAKPASRVRTASGSAHQPHGDLGGDAQRALRADERAEQVVAGRVRRPAAQLDHARRPA